jgi:hypothetical protein
VRFCFVMSPPSGLPLRPSHFCSTVLTSLGTFVCQVAIAASDWQSTLTQDPRGNFPDLRPVHATYVYGWSGITAATSEVYFHRGDQQTFDLEGRGRTVGLARILWRFDLNYRSAANAQTLRPIETHQVEILR